jgi:lipopolysaccharide transport system ATP-binding protein
LSLIIVDNLGKCYRLRRQQPPGMRYQALRDVLADKTKSVARRLWSAIRAPVSLSPLPSPLSEEFWGLRHVSFEVARGETLGIIGRNGAGKSTLLKILSRITEPTEGQVRLRGRVASLLEVGTGFHPELTGRENIFLNGAILGMTRAEIKRRFDEIVAFAEVEKFLDTPVKRYSSGMYVRLAFAVAAHLEPELLIVDEVLAVGDAEFQKKCLGKMESVARGQGRTVLFVSHNMDAIARLCSRCLLLRDGALHQLGDTRSVISTYLGGEGGISFRFTPGDGQAAAPDAVARLLEVFVHNRAHQAGHSYSIREPVGLTMTYEVLREDLPLVDNFNVFNEQGALLFVAHNASRPQYNRARKRGIYRSTAWIPPDLLPEGLFSASAAVITISPFQAHFHHERAVSFQLLEPGDGSSARGNFVGPIPGVIRPLLQWETEKTDHGTTDRSTDHRTTDHRTTK